MKRLLLLLGATALSVAGMAQTIANNSFETWRTSTSGALAPDTVMAPDSWFGADSLIIADGEFYGSLIAISPTVWQRQLYKEATIVHTGSYSAKLVTKKQDTLGVFPGIMSNAQANVAISIVGGSPSLGGITYSGGTATTYHITTVSAWVQYAPGTGLDSGSMSVSAYATVFGLDSMIGSGTVTVGNTSGSWTQITATLTYNGSGLPVDTVRIIFTSSAGTNNEIGSTMYVDDVTMTGTLPNEVQNVFGESAAVAVYPNPASDELNIRGQVNAAYTIALFSVNGQQVSTSTVKGAGSVDISSLAAGMYFYNITDAAGNSQHGKVNVIH